MVRYRFTRWWWSQGRFTKASLHFRDSGVCLCGAGLIHAIYVVGKYSSREQYMRERAAHSHVHSAPCSPCHQLSEAFSVGYRVALKPRVHKISC